ncbi:MAG: choice-of-anchor D domain-containing protein, partial [Pseudomonadota bacterium]|nr:choice-of-anchor D domain-containing protein [Pseudomonadota bacterium]
PPPHCLSPLYGSEPEIGAIIDFGTVDPNNPVNPDTGDPISQIITIQEQGNATLIIKEANIKDNNSESFVFAEVFSPIEIADNSPQHELKIYCIPPEEGEYRALLTLNTNAPPPNDVVTYELLCHGGPLTEMTSIGYQSQPSFEPPNNLITFPPTQVGQIVSSELVIENQGSSLLSINSIEINDNTNTFSLTSPKPSLSSPLEIMQGQLQTITLACNPTDDNVSPKEATLIIGTNDPDHPQGVEYILRCRVDHPIYHSTPAPAKALEFGQVPIGESKTLALTLNQEGPIDLEVDLKTPPSNGFQLVSPPSFPMTLTATSNTTTLNVHCTPSEPGLYSGQLQLTSTDPNWPTISYPLVCEGIKPRYVSQPPPSEDLPWVVGKTVIQETISNSLKIMNQGNVELVISDAILLPSAGPFGIETPLPQVIPSGDERIITVSCTPTEVLLDDETILELVTNDPNLPRPRYRVSCQGTSIPEPSYDSLPAPQQPLTINTFGMLAATTQLEITNNGASDLIIDPPQITADSEQIFQLLSLSVSAPIPVGESRTVTIQCTPLAPDQSYQATLEVTTNDTARPKVSYPLACSAATIPRLDIGSGPIEAIIDKTFSIDKIEVAYAELTGADAQAFTLIEPAIPLSATKTSIWSDSLQVQCQPQEGLNAAQLVLYDTESKIISIYELTCDGITAAAPTYVSTPPVETTIDFGKTPINVTAEAQLIITGRELTLESFTITS